MIAKHPAATHWFIALIVSVFLSLCAMAVRLRAEPPAVLSGHRLPQIGIAEFQNQLLPGSVSDDREISLGGISDLHRRSDDPPGEFWVVTDRGPNGQVAIDSGDGRSTKRRTFPIPEFVPTILRVKLSGDSLEIKQAIPLSGRSRRPISGRPNLPAIDDGGYNFAGTTPLPLDPSGVDTEGLVRTKAGQFWLAEEYRPSLLKVDANGKVLCRYVARGQSIPGADYDVASVLPEIYARRKDNRGFEGLALSNDEKTLYAALQSALENPSAEASKASRLVRILAFDLQRERPVAEFAYLFERASDYSEETDPGDMKIGAMAMRGADEMLVLERNDKTSRIYSVKLTGCTNLLEHASHSATGSDALETVEQLQAVGIEPMQKTLLVDLAPFAELPGKLEGLSVVDRKTIAVANDNDFGFSGFDSDGRAIPNDQSTCIWTLNIGDTK